MRKAPDNRSAGRKKRWTCVVPLTLSGLAILIIVGLAATPATAFGSLTVLGQLAAAAKDPISVALIVLGVMGFMALYPVWLDRGGAKKKWRHAHEADGRGVPWKFLIACVESWLLAATMVFAVGALAGMFLFTIRLMNANQPAVIERNLQERISTLKQTLRKSDQSQSQNPSEEASAAAQAMWAFLETNFGRLTDDQKARGYALVGAQYVQLERGEYVRTNEAIRKLDELPPRLIAFSDGLWNYYCSVRSARDPSWQPPPTRRVADQRLFEQIEMERAWNRREIGEVSRLALEYIRHFAGDEEERGNFQRVLFLGNAHAYAAMSADLSAVEGQELARAHAIAGLRIGELGRTAIGTDNLTMCDFRRLIAQCHSVLGKCHEKGSDFPKAAAEYEMALGILESLVLEQQVVGQLNEAVEICGRLATIYGSIGDFDAQRKCEQRNAALRRASEAG